MGQFLGKVWNALGNLFSLSSHDEDVERAREELERALEEISCRRDADQIGQDFRRGGMDIQHAMYKCRQ